MAAHDGASRTSPIRCATAASPRAEIARKVDEVLELVGLSEYARAPGVALSGGQMQRVALARSLVYEPQLLLLDEPLSNLDAKLRLRLRDDLRRIIKEARVTAVYVTHDQAEAVVLGDRIGVMRDGKLLQMSPAGRGLQRPADLFVANFTGASNLLAGRVIARNGEFGTVDAGGHRLTALMPGMHCRAMVKIALRPENVRLGGERGASPTSLHRPRLGAPLSGHADGLRARCPRRAARGARTRHQRPPRHRQRRRGGAPPDVVLGLSRIRPGGAGIASPRVAVQKSASFSRAKSDMRTTEPKPH